jgi:hypothetical protein
VSGPARVGAPVFGLTPASAALSPASLSPLSGPLSGSLSSPLRALQSALSASPLLAAGVEVEGDARAPIVRWQGSLSQEFRAIKTKMVPHVVFDKVDEGNRYCEVWVHSAALFFVHCPPFAFRSQPALMVHQP